MQTIDAREHWCEDNPPHQKSLQKIKIDAHRIREVKRPFEANCGNCFTRMTAGTWRCPTHGEDVESCISATTTGQD